MVPGARLVILGKQGSGKGTQCVRLARHYVVPHISTGDLFRAAVKAGTSEYAKRAKEYMEAGELIPDDIVVGVVRERLTQNDTGHRGFILDGFPRTTFQAEELEKMLEPRDLDLAINLEVPMEMVLKRLADRRVCRDCGANYSVGTPPKVDWTCDTCGGEVVQRGDDTTDAIKRRLVLYEKETQPLIAWYQERGKLETVDGVGSPDLVSSRLIHAIDRRRGRDVTVSP
ncbi:MAG: adenylate kinase [Actinomycetota bacterium]|nr:adenylate kinase [Actinomycetota bacterium]